MHEILWLKALAKSLVLPPGGPLLIAFAGLALWSRRPRLARALVGIGLVALLALSLPVVAGLLAGSFGEQRPFDRARAADAQAIVILGGGTRPNAREYGGETLGRLTLERVRYGARVARVTKLPILVTGGTVGSSVAEAELMRAALEQEYAVKVRWVESRSLNTRENARLASALLAPEGIHRVILVAHAFDMPRATEEFRAVGIATIPAPTGLPGPPGEIDATDFLPSVGALETSYYVLYEMLACLVYALPARSS